MWSGHWAHYALTSVGPSLGLAPGLLTVPPFQLPFAGTAAFCSGESLQLEMQPGAVDSGLQHRGDIGEELRTARPSCLRIRTGWTHDRHKAAATPATPGSVMPTSPASPTHPCLPNSLSPPRCPSFQIPGPRQKPKNRPGSCAGC